MAKPKSIKKYILIPTWVILLSVVFGFGYFTAQITKPSIEKIEGLTNKQAGEPAEVDFSLFWDAWLVIEDKFVDREQLDTKLMLYGAINGLIGSLNDPHSIFMEPQESKKFLDDIGGSFEGIGAEIGIRKGILTIITPLEGNPAQKAGLRAGDKILKIDDTSTADLTIDEAVNLIRGTKGTEVALFISREATEETMEIKIVRETIKIPVIKLDLIDTEQGKVAHIQLYHFTESSSGDFQKTVKQALDNNIKGVIIDVRNNPGGYLEVAVDIASWFLAQGELVVAEDFGNGQRNEFYSKGYGALENIPVVVLINQGSASASEILAGALRDIRKTKIVGQKSFGKGSVQQLEKLKGGSSLKITVAKWLTPLGISINDEGIMPDTEVEITIEDIEEMRDPQLDKAIEIIKEILE